MSSFRGIRTLVIIGVNERGDKRFLAIEDGVRESTQSWREVLLKLKARGMNAPTLGIGDGAMGFGAALEEIYPDTRQQRCWMHKTGNVLNCVPKLIQPKVKSALHEIWQAETRNDAYKAFDLFIATYEAKYPKATLTLQKDRGNYSPPKKYLKKHLTGFCTRKIQFCTSQPNLCDKQLRPIARLMTVRFCRFVRVSSFYPHLLAYRSPKKAVL